MPGTRVETIVIILASALAEQKWQILSTVIAAYVSWCLASDKSFDLLDYCTANGQALRWSRMLLGYASVLRSITVLPESHKLDMGRQCGTLIKRAGCNRLHWNRVETNRTGGEKSPCDLRIFEAQTFVQILETRFPPNRFFVQALDPPIFDRLEKEVRIKHLGSRRHVAPRVDQIVA